MVDLLCSDASLLVLAHKYVSNYTLRGTVLQEYPLVFVGVSVEQKVRD